MNKHAVLQLILEKLSVDLDIAQRAAQTAYETATHEENIAENKYDTLGLEASYLAAGQAKRVEEIKQSLTLCQNLQLRAYDDQRGIEVGALLGLEDENGRQQWLFLAPDAAGLKVEVVGQPVTVITPRSPMGNSLLGKFEGDEVEILVAGTRQHFTVTEAKETTQWTGSSTPSNISSSSCLLWHWIALAMTSRVRCGANFSMKSHMKPRRNVPRRKPILVTLDSNNSLASSTTKSLSSWVSTAILATIPTPRPRRT